MKVFMADVCNVCSYIGCFISKYMETLTPGRA